MGKHKKSWSQFQAKSSWTMFRIMSEFVDGFETLEKFGPCVSIFGSARTKPSSPYYQLAEKVANRFSNEGYGIITGGGPGIMEAGNKGAQEANGSSVGLNIDLPFEQTANPYIDQDKLITFNYFFVRKVMFVKYAQGFILLPGGFGTLDELFEVLTLIQTEKITPVPVVLMGSSFWNGLIDWIKNELLATEATISPEDLDLIHITDEIDTAVTIINNHYLKASLEPNF